jgi:hypothetical protein
MNLISGRDRRNVRETVSQDPEVTHDTILKRDELPAQRRFHDGYDR